MDAVEIAASLRELAVYMRLERDPHRARAYERAAETIGSIHDLEQRVAEGTLIGLPGIGNSISRVVSELHLQGMVPSLNRLRELWPHTVVELSQLPGLGTQKARILWEQLKPASLDELI